jgi:hypothetical protein
MSLPDDFTTGSQLTAAEYDAAMAQVNTLTTEISAALTSIAAGTDITVAGNTVSLSSGAQADLALAASALQSLTAGTDITVSGDTVGLSSAAQSALALANSALQSVGAGTDITVSGNTVSLSSPAQALLALAATAYQKPGSGIPATDMASAVQTELTAVGSIEAITGLIKGNGSGTFAAAAAGTDFQSANAKVIYVNDHGADPTGATFSDTAVAAAVTALGSSPGAIVFGPGTYKIANSVGTFGAGQSIIGQGRGLTTLSFHGTGDVMWVKGTSTTNPPAGGVISGLTIDGASAGTGASSAGIHAGDIFGLKIDNVLVQNFTVTGSKGIWFDDRVAWMERSDVSAVVINCTTCVLFDGSTQTGLFPSFDYSRYNFEIVPFANQNGVTLTGNAQWAGCQVRIIGNPQAGSSNTGAILTVGTSGTDGSQIAGGTSLAISMECDGTSGQVGHAAINVGSDASLIAFGTLNFANYVSGLAFTPGTVTGKMAFTELGGGGWGGTGVAGIGMLGPCQIVTAGSETFTIVSGSVTQITGTAIQGYSPIIGDRILIPNAPASTGAGTASGLSNVPANGIYVVTAVGSNLSVARSGDMSWTVPFGLSVYVEAPVGSGWGGQCIFTVVDTANNRGTWTYGSFSMQWAITGGVNPPLKKLVSEYAGTTSLSAQPFPKNVNGASPTGLRVDTMIGPGAGGGSGRRGAANTVRCGGGGGGGGGMLSGFYIPAAQFGSTWALTIPAAGAGGSAVTANDTNGNTGSSPGLVQFQTGSYDLLLTAPAGGGGGTATAGAGSPFSGGGGTSTGQDGASASATGGPGVSNGEYFLGVPAGGAAGGGITSGNVAGAGAAGSFSPFYTGVTVGAAGVVDTTAPTSPTVVDGVPGPGSGSGAASITTAAQAGAVGTSYGAGGAGGGASLDGNNSGAGGAGGPGFVRLIWDYA